jgi:membrane-bound lytic murein transglycosylase D
MIMAAMIIAGNPALYGFETGGADVLAFEHVTVPNALDLKILAEWIGGSVDDLRELNPELRRTTTPMGDHDLKVPLGTAATIRTKLATTDPSYVTFTFHTIKRGETLASIARRYRVSLAELRSANDLTSRSKIRVSQALMIPQRTTSGLPSSVAARSSAPRRVATVSGPSTYQVRRGDTLFSIARRFGTTVSAIKQLNRLQTDNINIGDRLALR